MAAGRNVDYTQKDMEKMTGLDRIQFKRTLEKVCDYYNFEIQDFKKEKDNPNSHYTFPPEIAELLAMLIRNYNDHPITLARIRNGNSIVKATDVEKYNKKINDDIDGELHEVFMKAMYCRQGHFVSRNIADWTSEFVKQLMYFIVNLSSLPNEDVGKALAKFSKELDLMNYCLYRSNYFLVKANQSNKEMAADLYKTSDERREIDEKLNTQNISIDRLIAEMIRWMLPEVKKIRDEKYKDFRPTEDADLYSLLLGFDPEDASDEMWRELYYRTEVDKFLNSTMFENNLYVVEHDHEKREQWKAITEKIKCKEFKEPGELTLEEKKRGVRANIADLEEQLRLHKEELERLETEEEEPSEDTLSFVDEMKQDYREYCSELDKKYKRLTDIVDEFVGEAMQELLG